MKYYIIAVAIMVLSVFAPLLGSQDAKALSVYDNPVYTEKLEWGACDMSTTFFGNMVNSYTGTRTLSNHIDPDNYYWGVVKHETGFYFFSIKKTEATVNGGGFGYWSANSSLKTYGIPVDVGTIFNDVENYSYVDVNVNMTTCEVVNANDFGSPFDDRFYGAGVTNSWALILYDVFHDNSAYDTEIWFLNVPFVAPVDYEGVIPPDSWTPPVSLPDYSDIVSVNYEVQNKRIKFWNSTVWGDVDVSELQCRFTLAGVTSGVLYDVQGSCNEEMRVVDVEVYEVYAVRLDVMFDTNNDGIFFPDEPSELAGSVLLNIKVDGQTFAGGGGSNWNDNNRFEPSSCTQEFFPFINVVGCMEMFGKALSILSFGTVNIGNVYNQEGCIALNTLGGWLNVPSQTVCPQIDSAIRAIVTPFVTLALAMGAVAFITRQKAEDIG